MEHKRNSFVFYADWVEILMDYPAEVRLEVYDAVMRYAVSGKLSELKPQAKMAFSFIRKQIDRDNEKYDEIIVKRSEAGRKGGKNKQTQAKQANANKTSKCKQTQANQADNVNVNVDVNDNVLKKEKGNTVVLPKKNKTQEPPLPKIEKTEKAAYAEYVSMTNAEYAALVERYGEQAAREMIDILDNYKGSNGKKYKSDYRAILSWVAGRWEEEEKRKNNSTYATNRNVNGNKGGRGFMFSREQQDAILRAADQIPD